MPVRPDNTLVAKSFLLNISFPSEDVGAILTMPRAICHMTGRRAGVRRTGHYMKYESDSTIVYAMVFISGSARNENFYYLSDTVSRLSEVSKHFVSRQLCSRVTLSSSRHLCLLEKIPMSLLCLRPLSVVDNKYAVTDFKVIILDRFE